jgi:hypothetical protein
MKLNRTLQSTIHLINTRIGKIKKYKFRLFSVYCDLFTAYPDGQIRRYECLKHMENALNVQT